MKARQHLPTIMSSFIGIIAIVVMASCGYSIWNDLHERGYLAFKKDEPIPARALHGSEVPEMISAETQVFELPSHLDGYRKRIDDRYISDFSN